MQKIAVVWQHCFRALYVHGSFELGPARTACIVGVEKLSVKHCQSASAAHSNRALEQANFLLKIDFLVSECAVCAIC